MQITLVSSKKLSQVVLKKADAVIMRVVVRPYERLDLLDTATHSLSSSGNVLYVQKNRLFLVGSESILSASVPEEINTADFAASIGHFKTSPLKKELSKRLGDEPLSAIRTLSFKVRTFTIVYGSEKMIVRVKEYSSANSKADFFYRMDGAELTELMVFLNTQGFSVLPFSAYLANFFEPKAEDAEVKNPTKIESRKTEKIELKEDSKKKEGSNKKEPEEEKDTCKGSFENFCKEENKKLEAKVLEAYKIAEEKSKGNYLLVLYKAFLKYYSNKLFSMSKAKKRTELYCKALEALAAVSARTAAKKQMKRYLEFSGADKCTVEEKLPPKPKGKKIEKALKLAKKALKK